jgi:L-amino acid N-acyltransferase YncA
MSNIQIIPATSDHMPAIANIYGHHVLTGLASFEADAPSETEMSRRWHAILEASFPYMVALWEGEVAGYCYGSSYRPRHAYRFSVETSIYLDDRYQGKGIAKTLMTELEEKLRLLGKKQMIAVIGDSDNHASIGLHRAIGFEHVGILKDIGWKHDRWVDSVLMQKTILDKPA